MILMNSKKEIARYEIMPKKSIRFKIIFGIPQRNIVFEVKFQNN